MAVEPTIVSDDSPTTRDGADIFTTVKRYGEIWQIRTGLERTLLGPTTPPWFELAGHPGSMRIKTGRFRSAWKVHAAGRAFHVKVFHRPRRWPEWLVPSGGSKAGREWRTHVEAHRRGVPVAAPLAMGTRSRREATAVLICQWLEHCDLLSESLFSSQGIKRTPSNKGMRNALVLAVAKLFAAAHRAGFVHRDAHVGNILVRRGDTPERTAYFVDLHGGRFHRSPIGQRVAVPSIAQLAHGVAAFASRTERMRFLRVYLANPGSRETAPVGKTNLHGWWRAIAAATDQHARALARGRDQRLRRNGKYFATLRIGGGWRATVALRLERRHRFPERHVPDRMPEKWRRCLALMIPHNQGDRSAGTMKAINKSVVAGSQPPLPLGRPPVRVRTQTGGSVSPNPLKGLSPERAFVASHGLDPAQVQACGAAPESRADPGMNPQPDDELIIDRQKAPSIGTRISWTLLGSEHRRIFETCHRLRHRDVPSPLVLGIVEHRRFGLIDETILIRPGPAADSKESG